MNIKCYNGYDERKVKAMKQEIFMKVTKDKFEFPIAMGDTAEELSALLGVSSVRDIRQKCKKSESAFRYVTINIRKGE